MKTTTLNPAGTDLCIQAEVHDGELYLSILALTGRLQRVAGIEAAVGRIFPEKLLHERLGLAAALMTELAAKLTGKPAAGLTLTGEEKTMLVDALGSAAGALDAADYFAGLPPESREKLRKLEKLQYKIEDHPVA